MSTLPQPTFRLRPAVRDVANHLHAELAAEKDPTEALEILSRLVSDSRMKRVWNEIYKRKRDGNRGFLYPARLTNASNAAAYRERAHGLRKKGGEQNRQDAEFLELEARLIGLIPETPVRSKWREQDLAAQSFFTRAYRLAVTAPKPVALADIQQKVMKLRQIADKLKSLAAELESIPIHVTEIYAEKVREIASHCEDDAKVMEPDLANEPWIIVRKRGNLRQRIFVRSLAHTTHLLFGNTLYGAIATITNVVFGLTPDTSLDAQELVDDNVVAILADNAPQIHPSFGPLIYPMMKARMKNPA